MPVFCGRAGGLRVLFVFIESEEMREKPSCNAAPLRVCICFWFHASGVANGSELLIHSFPVPFIMRSGGKKPLNEEYLVFVGINSMRHYSVVCFSLFEQFFEWRGLYCHNKRGGGGGEEGNAAFGAASWKGKDWLILPQLAVCAFRFMYLASSMSF